MYGFGHLAKLSGMLSLQVIQAMAPILTDKELASPPPKIIRTCCSFGSELHLMGIPFIKITEITSLQKMGGHHFLGDESENNGILYTRRGGFIDMGHLRDCADLTAYYYLLILEVKSKESIRTLTLGNEGGKKNLLLSIPPDISDADALLTAANIAYDLSVWHEIATWFGASFVPLIPERFSSFSPEDLYSNLLGVYLGMAAINSDLPYNEAMDGLLRQKLNELQAVHTMQETEMAMEAVEGKWWTREKALPSRKILLQRHFGDSEVLTPWLIPDSLNKNIPVTLPFPARPANSDYYQLSIQLNYRFPSREIFLDRKYRCIDSQDFAEIVSFIVKDIVQKTADDPPKKNISSDSLRLTKRSRSKHK